MFNSPEALTALQRILPDLSYDKLMRTRNAILPPYRSNAPRFYSSRDLDLLVVAYRLQKTLDPMSYQILGCIARNARSKGLDEISVFQELLDQALLDQNAEADGDAPAAAELMTA